MNSENKFCVYLHKRSDTNKVFYVGRGTSRRPTENTGRNKYWMRIVKKHGRTVQIVSSNLTLDQSNKLEIRLIEVYKKHGFSLANFTNGGDGVGGYKHSIESKRKMSLAKIGKPRPHTKEWNQKISKARSNFWSKVHSGEIPYIYKMSKEGKERHAQAGRNRKGKPNTFSKSLICNETKEIFECIAQAASCHGIDSGNLGKHLNRKKYYNTISGRTYSWL